MSVVSVCLCWLGFLFPNCSAHGHAPSGNSSQFKEERGYSWFGHKSYRLIPLHPVPSQQGMAEVPEKLFTGTEAEFSCIAGLSPHKVTLKGSWELGQLHGLSSSFSDAASSRGLQKHRKSRRWEFLSEAPRASPPAGHLCPADTHALPFRSITFSWPSPSVRTQGNSAMPRKS